MDPSARFGLFILCWAQYLSVSNVKKYGILLLRARASQKIKWKAWVKNYHNKGASNKSKIDLILLIFCERVFNDSPNLLNSSHLAINWYINLILWSIVSHVLQIQLRYVSKQSNVKAEILRKIPVKLSVKSSTEAAILFASTSNRFSSSILAVWEFDGLCSFGPAVELDASTISFPTDWLTNSISQ